MKIKHLFSLLLVVLLLVTLSGCGAVDNLQMFKSDSSTDGQSGTPESSDGAVTTEQDLQLDASANANGTDNSGNAQSSGNGEGGSSSDSAAQSRQVVLYFASADGKSLEAETRDIPKQEGMARATINQLISGPQDEALLPTLPAATILEDINIANGVCTVDFSSELLDDLSDDAQAQLLVVYSIVNTLSQFDTVDHVQILVNGAAISDGLGGVDISSTLSAVQF